MAEVWEHENEQARGAWNTNAEFWDERMGEGNDFFNVLVWPAVERLLRPAAGELLLDIACGNGLASRRMARIGARVIACDFSEAMIERAVMCGAKMGAGQEGIDYRVVDATKREALLALGDAEAFDGALCNMALMDMAEIMPLMQTLAILLRPNGRFVFSVMHPCFNNPATVQVGELEDRAGRMVTTYSVKVARYMTSHTQRGLAIVGQPEPHPYFHRPLEKLLAPAFAAGLVLDGLEEAAFPKEHGDGSSPMSWKRYSEIPAALIVRLRRSAPIHSRPFNDKSLT